MTAILRTESGQLRLPLRLVWNDGERRPRAPVRIVATVLLVLTLANTGRTIRPTLLSGSGPIADSVNTLVGGIPQSGAIALGVVFAALVLDRRRLSDLGVRVEPGAWRGFAGGLAIGAGFLGLSVLLGIAFGYYDLVGMGPTGGPAVWLAIVAVTGLSQLLVVVAEELLGRGYLITNVTEGFEGVSLVPRSVAAGIAVLVASLFFYLTHSTRGLVFGLMAGGLAVLLGIAYVLGGDLSVPIGIHFGANFAGGLLGTQPQSASLLQLRAGSTVADSLVLPPEAVVVRIAGSALGIAVLLWWYRARGGGLRVSPTIARPALRWRDESEATSGQS